MDILYAQYDNLLRQVKGKPERYLINKIKWNQRMLAIKGPRGSGKTTLMLQYIGNHLQKPRNETLYFSADDYFFYTNTLLETADTFYKNGGRYLFIDEVHKYPRWSVELKNIYDRYPDMQVVFSSSSALDIYRGSADLSRRVIHYNLPGLSFREFLYFNNKISFPSYTLKEIIKNHTEISHAVLDEIQPLPLFKQYLKYGYLPIFLESDPADIPLRLAQIINTVIENDLAYIQDYSSGTAFKVKKFLGVLAESVPFKPNIAALARKLDVSRDSIYAWLTQLENARLLNLLMGEGKGVSQLQKPEKVYLENTNLMYALKPHPEIGTVRETFLLTQIINHGTEVALPGTGDFVVNDIYIETGGKSKSTKQVREQTQFVVAADDIEIGFAKKIPLWMFGFLY